MAYGSADVSQVIWRLGMLYSCFIALPTVLLALFIEVI